jgi:DNA-binding NarL/FixJ family response regulator
MTTRVLLIDDQELIRRGLARSFERNDSFTVIGQAAMVQEGLAKAAELLPDVVVCDVRLPDGSGLDLVRTLRSGSDRIGLVVLTMYAGDDQIFAALEAGASAFVGKDAPADDVVAAAAHAVVSPLAFTAAGLPEAMMRRMTSTSPRLSEREQQVLDMLAEGLGVGPISGKLFISESTTKTHIAKIYQKLGAANRAQALVTAMRLGLLTEPVLGG